MLKKSVLSVLLCCIILLFSGCSVGTGDLPKLLQDGTGHFASAFESFLRSVSAKSFADSYAAIEEPSFIDWQTTRLYYEQLGENEQLAYRCIYNNIFGQPERIAVPLLDDGELDRLYAALRNDNPQLLFLGDKASLLTAGMHCYFVPTYSMDYWQARETITDTAATARDILRQIPQQANEFEKLLFVHDTLCDMCTYGDLGNASHCNGALSDRTATCAGYSKALKLMLDMLGIRSCTVTGNAVEDSETVSHMWLAVCIDGAWSFCDPTWDDPVSEDGRQTVEHSYFSMTRERLGLTHFDITMPSGIVCDSENADYYRRLGVYCDGENDEDVLLYGMRQALADGRNNAEFRFADQQLLQQMCTALFEEDLIYSLLRQVQDANETLVTNRISYAADETHCYLKLNFVFEE